MFRDTDGKNHNTGKKWDTVDCLAAARAYADLINDYANPNLGYDRLLPDNEAKLMEIFERSRLNYKKSVAIEIQENIANGLRDNEAVTKVAENCRRSVDVSISDVQVSYSVSRSGINCLTARVLIRVWITSSPVTRKTARWKSIRWATKKASLSRIRPAIANRLAFASEIC